MKTRIMKLMTLLLICSLLFSLTGCEKLDYREAIDLYNSGRFDEAAEMFAALGDYEDSGEMQTLSQYWAALTLAEAGKYEEALPRFLKLGDYEDSPERVIECTYQIALAEFDAGNFTDAQIHFLEVADYRQAPEYLRRINWQKLFDAVAGIGEEGIHTGTSEGMNLQIIAKTGEPDQLTFFVSHEKDMGYAFYDDLALTLTRDSLVADFTATSSFTMNYVDGQIGSEQKASGKVDISVCNADTVLKVDTFQMTTTDNLGKTTTSDDPADMLMAEDMAQNLIDLLSVIPALLLEAGIELTLHDIGFSAM